jgi:hypothetical protein
LTHQFFEIIIFILVKALYIKHTKPFSLLFCGFAGAGNFISTASSRFAGELVPSFEFLNFFE